MKKIMLKSIQVKALKKNLDEAKEPAQVVVTGTPVKDNKLPPMTKEDVAEDMGWKFTDAVRKVKCFRNWFLRCNDANMKTILLKLMKVAKAEALLLQSALNYGNSVDDDNDVDGGEI